jgi:hypothetical protein
MINTITKNYLRGEFVSYKMILDNGKEFSVPLEPANSDYQAIQEWIKEGGTVIDNPPLPAEKPSE